MTAATLPHRAAAVLTSAAEVPGLTYAQLHVLVLLLDGPKRLTDLWKATGTEQPSSTTRLVQRLEQRRLVSRSTGQTDRRTQILDLTPEGRFAVGEFLAYGDKHARSQP